MSERWKYQITTGGSWGLFMTLLMAFFESEKTSFLAQLFTWQFYFRLIAFLITGIFILGYFTWKAKTKETGS